MKTIRCMMLIFLPIVLLNAGCAAKAFHDNERPQPASAVLEQSAKKENVDFKPERMLIWKAYLSLEVNDVKEAVGKIATLTEQSGGYVESKSESSGESAELALRIPVQLFRGAIASLEELGTVKHRSIQGEDITEQYIDVEARLKNKIALRDRLKQLLEKATAVKDILAIEAELNRVQSDIDSMEGKIKSLKGQVDLATVHVSLKRRPILGPLGYLFKGLWWGIKKLFVLRE
ncbi:MAG: DUF4349 domain-containing protein [Deltaproteobacteria bacterium]